MQGFFEELQRRKVYRVAVAYVIAAGGAIQLASAVFPAWELPLWSLRLVIVLLLIGFPIALVLAWAFDVTPRGIQTTPTAEVAYALGTTHRRRNVFILLGLGLASAAVAGVFVLPRVAARKVEKSIAVLPFENFSDDKSNTYFADGIQDDILTALSRIGDLKVTSRTSVMGYRNSSKNVRDIGKALDAGAILEGSVRSDGKRVRVNVQLINAENDEHIWANEYDRKLTDVFDIQSSLAREIAAALQAHLSPSEKDRMTRSPTNNGEAYLAVVQARDLQGAVEDRAKQEQAEQLYQRALQLDPNFALAMANFSVLESWMYHTWDPTPARREQARTLADRALELQPELPEAHLARAYSYYYGTSDYDAALRELRMAQKGLPNSMEVYLLIGAIQRRQGNWAESNTNIEKAVALSPKDNWALQNLAINYEMQRKLPEAADAIGRAIKITPESFSLWEMKARIAIEQSGDFSVGEEGFAGAARNAPNESTRLHFQLARAGRLVLARRFQEAAQFAESLPDASLAQAELQGEKYLILGQARRGNADETGARAAFTKAKEIIEAGLAQNSSNVDARSGYALVLVYLGEKERALAEAKAILEARPISKDAFHGPDILIAAAGVYALTGEKDRALAALEKLLSIPSLLTPMMLKLDPTWDSLRDNPRFQKLLTPRQV